LFLFFAQYRASASSPVTREGLGRFRRAGLNATLMQQRQWELAAICPAAGVDSSWMLAAMR
jgi:hypothetical protein